MDRINEKAKYFLTALLDVYKDEQNRELHAMPKLKVTADVTEDVTAMLIAVCVISNQMTGLDDDLIGFTHTLNRLAIQCVFESKENGHEE